MLKPHRLIGAASAAACLCLLAGCATPNINSLNPDTGPERTLVEIDGDTAFATAYWNAGTLTEQALPGVFLSARLFTVPAGTSLGTHPVQLQRFGKRGNMARFTVTAAQPFGAPRLDRVSLLYADFQPAGQVNTWLYVQGANVDTGAEVLINNTVVPSAAHKGIQNDLLGVAPQDLRYPIYHHLALIAAPGVQATGTNLNVKIRNADGTESNTVSYRLPASLAMLDSDGDRLLDDWETNGFDADGDGTVDIDLPGLGADPLRPDIFLEVDVMNGLANPPGNAVWNAMTAAFAAAPIINPRGANGIELHLDRRGTVPFWQTIDFGGTETMTHRQFNTLKNVNFDDANRDNIYHYCIWANMRPNGSSGISDVNWGSGGDDCIVSFDDFNAAFQTAQSMAETLLHELGHNLDQRHGGATHAQNNPTYNSMMSYNWQLRTGRSNAWRRNNPVYAPYFYLTNAAVETGGAIPGGWTGVTIDYSSGMGRTLDENELDEPTGLYNGNPVDWNMDGDSTDTSVDRDLSDDGDANDNVDDFANWADLDYGGPASDGFN